MSGMEAVKEEFTTLAELRPDVRAVIEEKGPWYTVAFGASLPDTKARAEVHVRLEDDGRVRVSVAVVREERDLGPATEAEATYLIGLTKLPQLLVTEGTVRQI